MTGTKGTINFTSSVSGSNLKNIFSSTNYLVVSSFSALFKVTFISGYDNRNMSNLLWTSTLFGGGVGTAGVQSSRSVVKFK